LAKGQSIAAQSLLFFLLILPSAGKSQKPPSAPRSSPQVSGRLIGTDGAHQIILEYKTNRGNGTFIGNTQAACIIPGATSSSVAVPIGLSEIQERSQLTLFYVRHTFHTKKGRRTENLILAIRFDQPDSVHRISKGQTLPCYKAAPSQAPK
jgi:hypothetical protein